MRPRPLIATVSTVPRGSRCIVLTVIHPARVDPDTWRDTSAHLEELGLLPGEVIQKIGSSGPAGPIILRCMGSKVAISREVARSIVVGPTTKC